MTEIEIKLPVGDAREARAKILSLKARLTRERHAEENVLYDFEDLRLIGKKQAVRLRRTGQKGFLTFKDTPRQARSFKIRREFETALSSPAQAAKILKSLGLKAVFSYRKHRTLFVKGRLRIALDETSIGNFVELEGEQHEIARFAEAMGFERGDFIKADYVTLIKEKEKERPA